MAQNDQTLIKKGTPLKIKVLRGSAGRKEYSFSEPFSIGRDESCQIRMQDHSVSRMHVEVYLRDGCWWIRDLNSANGTLVEGRKVDRLPVTKPTMIELGVEGPILSFEPAAARSAQETVHNSAQSVTECQQRYFGKLADGQVGQHTLFVRQAFQRVQRKQKGKYFTVIGTVVGLLVLASGYGYFQHQKIGRQRQVAVDLFYTMKTIEVRLAKLETDIAAMGIKVDTEAIEREQALVRQSALEYEELIEKLGVYSKHMSEQERLIIGMARVFGECELRRPAAFVSEVQKYIDIWKQPQMRLKLKLALRRADENGFTADIVKAFDQYGLPRQFFYLAVQESALDPRACGPETRYGFAKGMWQFIPPTAEAYKLRTGPLQLVRQFDPADERHDFKKSTEAAARYIRDIYQRDAEASGLLVMACYNWSETRVHGFVKSLPKEPKERNFWRLLEKFYSSIPSQTYEYIFLIFSAAVIGENPRLFGFDFDNPLAEVSELGTR